MNFNNIIIQGVKNTYNKENLKSYFLREFKKAKRDYFYNADDFFNPLFQKIEKLKKDINKKFVDEKKLYEDIIQKASRNELGFYKHYLTHCLDKKGITYENFKEQENKKCLIDKTKEFAEFGINKVSAKLNSTKITFVEVGLIEKGLKDAKKEIMSYLKASPFQQTDKHLSKLTINQIALKYVYEGNQITRGENGNAIAKLHGHNSGEKLFQRFTFYSSAANRTGRPIPCTPKKLDNKICLIESVIEILPANKKARAKDEVLILKSIQESEYQ